MRDREPGVKEAVHQKTSCVATQSEQLYKFVTATWAALAGRHAENLGSLLATHVILHTRNMPTSKKIDDNVHARTWAILSIACAATYQPMRIDEELRADNEFRTHWHAQRGGAPARVYVRPKKILRVAQPAKRQLIVMATDALDVARATSPGLLGQ